MDPSNFTVAWNSQWWQVSRNFERATAVDIVHRPLNPFRLAIPCSIRQFHSPVGCIHILRKSKSKQNKKLSQINKTAEMLDRRQQRPSSDIREWVRVWVCLFNWRRADLTQGKERQAHGEYKNKKTLSVLDNTQRRERTKDKRLKEKQNRPGGTKKTRTNKIKLK